MNRDDARQDIETFVSAWYQARITAEEAKKHVTINKGGYDNAAEAAYKLSLRLHSQLVESDGIDEHKEAAVLAYALGQSFPMIVKFAEVASEFTLPRYRDNCRADCTLTVYLSMLDVDRSAIESEPITYETLRAMFLLVATNNFPGETRTAMLIALSTLAFALERTYPQTLEEEITS